jgi:hypothetical protein
MPELPAFLKEFMDMRKNVNKNAKGPEELKKIRKGQTKPIETAVDGTTIASIIEKKPSKKVLADYLQKRCDALSKEKMK